MPRQRRYGRASLGREYSLRFSLQTCYCKNAPFCEFVAHQVSQADNHGQDCYHTQYPGVCRLETRFHRNKTFEEKEYRQCDNTRRQIGKGLHPVPGLRGNTLFIHPFPGMLQWIVSWHLDAEPNRAAVEKIRKCRKSGTKNISDIRFLQDQDPFKSDR